MFRNYFKIAIRNLRNNKVHSFINIGGLAVGMAVTMLIGLWIWDELSFDKYHQNYNSIAMVMQKQTYNGTVNTGKSIPIPLAAELRKSYPGDFKHVILSSQVWHHILATGEKKLSISGGFMEPDAPEMFSLKMLKGTRYGLKDPSSMLLSESVAKMIFGNTDPINKTVSFDNKANFKVTGVYQDPPQNTTFHYYYDLGFIGPWDYYQSDILSKTTVTDWGDNSYRIYVQMAPNADMARVSEKIKDTKLNHISKEDARYKPQIFLHPMSKWHLYSEFKNGVLVGGAIKYVWLFGIIGIFVLLLACINFMNLSTARSEKRAKEVGIRKAVGSLRGQLIGQFFCESILVALFAFALSLVLLALVMPYFNNVADKSISILWHNPLFWLIGIGFSLFTGLIAGSYPALYLSSFNPVRVLKGTFKAGRFATIPRKVLVVLQFTVSVVLIIGTIIVFKQIAFAQNRPVGYNRDGLINIEMATTDIQNHFDAVRTDLLQSDMVTEAAESTSPATEVHNNTSGLEWQGKPAGLTDDFAIVGVTHEFGKTMGWQFLDGRDFSRRFTTDSAGIVLNQTAAQYMGLKNPIGETVKFFGTNYKVIGVIKDMLMSSPYEPVKQTVFYINKGVNDNFNIRVNPKVSTAAALEKIEAVFKTYAPSAPFTYKFVDEVYARKFADEVRVGKLASVFALLAIFISCMGLFGMASFMAEQRTKEIGVRKVLGATVFGLWQLMSRDFVMLVIVSLCIATPLAYYFMHNWLQNYTYRADMPWWVFAITGLGAITITLLTVSYQSIKAALMNPVKSLRSE